MGNIALKRDPNFAPVSGGINDAGETRPFHTDTNGNQHVIVDSGGGGGTQYAEDAAHTSGDLGTMALAVRNDAGTALAGTTLDYIPLTTDAVGALWTDPQGNVASGATDAGNPLKIGGRYNATMPTLTDGQRGDAQLTTRGSLKVTLFGNDTNVGASFSADNADAGGTSATANKLVVVSRGTVYNGTTWDRMPGDTTGVAQRVYPIGATPITAASGNVANASAAATLAAAASKTTYITGFEISSSGATAGAVVTITVTGTVTGTLSYTYAAPTGVLLMGTPLFVEFPFPIPASAVNTAIVVTLPALGTGNTNATAVAHGFQL